MDNPPSKEKLVKLYNPDIDDFIQPFDINGDEKPVDFILHSKEIGTFPLPVADLIKRKLAERLAFRRGWQGSNYEDTKNAILKEIEVSQTPTR